jgi:hypothetical protein
MQEQLDHSSARDWHQINQRDPFDVRWWAGRLGVSGVEVLEAVRNVGPAVDDVRHFLSRAPCR